MDVAAGQEQTGGLEGYPGEQHGVPGGEMLAVGGHEVPLMALEQQGGEAQGGGVAAEGKRTLGRQQAAGGRQPCIPCLSGCMYPRILPFAWTVSPVSVVARPLLPARLQHPRPC